MSTVTQTLREKLGNLEISETELATQTGLDPATVTRLLAGEERLSPAIALHLGAFFLTSAEFWLDLQSREDVQRARAEFLPDYERLLRKRGEAAVEQARLWRRMRVETHAQEQAGQLLERLKTESAADIARSLLVGIETVDDVVALFQFLIGTWSPQPGWHPWEEGTPVSWQQEILRDLKRNHWPHFHSAVRESEYGREVFAALSRLVGPCMFGDRE